MAEIAVQVLFRFTVLQCDFRFMAFEYLMPKKEKVFYRENAHSCQPTKVAS